jgi:dihydroneopterin aldolase
MDKITIKELEVDTHVGVTPEEQARTQKLLITVVLELDLHQAGRTDQASATTPYDVVAAMIRKVVTERPRKLIEAVADEVAAAILDRRMATRVTVEVKKFSVPRSQWVAVEINRSQ